MRCGIHPLILPRASYSPSEAACSLCEPHGHRDRGLGGRGADNRAPGWEQQSSRPERQGSEESAPDRSLHLLEQPSDCRALSVLLASLLCVPNCIPISLRKKTSSSRLTDVLPVTQRVEEPKWEFPNDLGKAEYLVASRTPRKSANPCPQVTAPEPASMFSAPIWDAVFLASCTFGFVFRRRCV